jgi:homocysteine S-methyltransferase
MTRTQPHLPHLDGGLFLTDSGMETTLVFHEGMELPAFASFPLLETEKGRAWLSGYYAQHLKIAEARGLGFVLDTATWRANTDWGAQLGYDRAGLHRVNLAGVRLCQEVRDAWAGRVAPMVVSGVIGPRGDGYKAGRMTASEAEDYHGEQVASLSEAGADMISAMTISTVEEAIGIARAAGVRKVPAVISFTVETDGRLASGTSLAEAIADVDADTAGSPAYYMVNCAHPTHFAHLFAGRPSWADRIRGVRANASAMSHAELDNMQTLDDGDPADLGQRYRELASLLPNLNVLGGCCGTDHRHVAAVAEACCA